eukprot:9523196-Karenia_brevis.AAC.1
MSSGADDPPTKLDPWRGKSTLAPSPTRQSSMSSGSEWVHWTKLEDTVSLAVFEWDSGESNAPSAYHANVRPRD